MKAIISHDTDHITVNEHLFRDLIVQKFILRMSIEFLSGKISYTEYFNRWRELFKNKWQNIDELIDFNNMYGVPNTFFMAVNRGIGLQYSNDAAKIWIELMKERGCEIGNHGIGHESLRDVVSEKNKFSDLSGLSSSGIRMHYLKKTENTLNYLSQAGYTFDSSVRSFRNPYLIDSMWEFPIQIMDGWIIQNNRRWQTSDLKKAQEDSKFILEKAYEQGLDYVSIVFHDRYFNKGFKTWMEWYVWLVFYLKENKIEFVNFNNAMEELNVSVKKKPVTSS